MKEFDYTMQDPLGIHARPAGILAKEAGKYKSIVTIVKGAKKTDTRRLMTLMAMGIKGGETITVQVEGPDEETAVDAIHRFLSENHY